MTDTPATTPATGSELDTPSRVPARRTLSEADEKYHEKWVSFWFALAGAGGIGFFAWMWWGPKPYPSYLFTPILAVFLTLALLGLGIGQILWAKTLMGGEEAVQQREPHNASPQEQQAAVDRFMEGVDRTGIARHTLLRRTLLGGGALATALPLLSVLRYLNPQRPRSGALTYTGYTKDVRLVDDNNNPVQLGEIEIGGYITVFPENGVNNALAPVNLIRLGPGVNIPLPGRENWAVEGHVAYSKICTHLGCPVGLYEQQRHILLCPCHESQFNAKEGCKVMFGPAARPLPQLEIYLDDEGYFHATGDFDQPVGPSFWERK